MAQDRWQQTPVAEVQSDQFVRSQWIYTEVLMMALLLGLHCQLFVQEDPPLKQSTLVNITHSNYPGRHAVRPVIFVIMYKIIEKFQKLHPPNDI